MIRDKEQMYYDAVALSATGTSDTIDHRLDRDLGIGEPLVLVIVPRTVPDAADGNETYSFQLQTDDNTGFGSPTSVGPAIPITRGTAAGLKYCAFIPPDTLMERYSRISHTFGGTTPSVTVDGWLTSWRTLQNDAYYADAITIG